MKEALSCAGHISVVADRHFYKLVERATSCLIMSGMLRAVFKKIIFRKKRLLGGALAPLVTSQSANSHSCMSFGKHLPLLDLFSSDGQMLNVGEARGTLSRGGVLFSAAGKRPQISSICVTELEQTPHFKLQWHYNGVQSHLALRMEC